MRQTTSAWRSALIRCAMSAFLTPPILLLVPNAAAQSRTAEFHIPSTSLQRALIEVGRQSGVSVATLSADIPLVRSPALHGAMSVDRALTILLKDSGFRHRKSKAGGYVIERSDRRQRRAARRASTPPPAPISKPQSSADWSDYQDNEAIIITASKADLPLRDYAGGAYVVRVNDDVARSKAGRGSDAIVDLIPALSGTAMGSGRNKLFARGISDGGMIGSVQSIFSTYLGEQRVSYSAPDPNLQLFDVERIEALMGPHGTLYGSGSMAGVVRIQPKAPNLQRTEAEILGEIAAVRHGETGRTVNGVINLPIAQDHLAVRAVAYHVSEAGYLDNVVLNQKDTNRIDIYGGRAALRWAVDDDSQIDLSMAYQQSASRDVMHIFPKDNVVWDPKFDHGLKTYLPALQPYANKAFIPSLTYEKLSGDWTMKATLGMSAIDTREQYFILPDYVYRTHRDIRMMSADARAFGRWQGFDIVAGLSFISNHYQSDDQSVGEGLSLLRDNHIKTIDAAVYSEIRRKLGHGLTLMLGGRLSTTRETVSVDDPIDNIIPAVVRNNNSKFTPSASLSWRVADGHLLFAAYREGFRHNSLLPLPVGLDNPMVRPTRPDHIRMAEVGYRFTASKILEWSINGFWIDWRNINYNFIATDFGGILPSTLGDTKIWGLDSSISWQPMAGWTWNGGLSLNNKPKLDGLDTDPDTGMEQKFTLPISNAPSVTARLSSQYSFAISKKWDLRLQAAVRHQGKSFGEFQLPLPALTELSAEIRLVRDGQALWVRANNLLDSDAIRYGNGNPYLAFDLSYTPLQPRTISVGGSAKF